MILTIPALQSSNISVVRADGATKVTVAFNAQLAPAVVAKLLDVTYRHLKEYTRTESLDKLLGDELAEFYRARERTLLKMEDLAKELIERNAQYRRDLDLEQAAFVRERSREFEKITKELEVEFEDRQSTLAKREEQLNARAEELDDRASRHARRQLRMDFKDMIRTRSESFALSKKTIGKRKMVHGAYAALVGVTGYFAFVWVYQFAKWSASGPNLAEGPQAWLMAVFGIKAGAAVAALAAAIIFYIRWNDSWFRQHADEEFRMKRFELDIDRASWVVEMALEWGDDKGRDIPQGLVERLSAGLFDDRPQSQGSGTCGDGILMSLLKSSKKVSVEVPGLGRAELDNKGSRRLRDDLMRDGE